MAFRLLALAVPDPVKTKIERNIMECTMVVIVFRVNAGKVVNTRREVVVSGQLAYVQTRLGQLAYAYR